MSVDDVTDKLALLNSRISGVFSAVTVKVGDDVQSDFGTGKVTCIKDSGVGIALDKWTSVGVDAPQLFVNVATITLKKPTSNVVVDSTTKKEST